jgi:hypothetical protein
VILNAQAGDVTNTIFDVTFGNQQTLNLNIPFRTEQYLENIYVNGQKERPDFYTDSYHHYNDQASVSFNIIVGNDFVEFIHINYLGEVERMNRYLIDNPTLTITSNHQGKSFADIKIQPQVLPQLSAFAKNGLKIRKEDNLSSERLTSIPYGQEVYILEDLENKDVAIYELGSTKGNLKVGDLSSRMLRVLYNNVVGFTYGGYLVPLSQVGSESNTFNVVIKDWDLTFHGGEEVQLNNQLGIQKVNLNLATYPFLQMDKSQRALIASTLFPNILTKATISNLVEHNKTQTVTTKKGGYTEICEVTTEDYQIARIVYTKIKTDLTQTLKAEKTQYVTATKLNLRASTHLKSEILTSIPFGNIVEILNNNSNFITIQGIRGKMVKVKYNDQIGYVFDAYLSPTQPFTTSSKKQSDPTRFENVVKYRSNNKWKHSSGFPDEMNWHISPDVSQWAIVPCRDKFQALRTIKGICPTLENLQFSWNENKKAYNVSSSNPKIKISVTDNSWVISYPDSHSQYPSEHIVVVINTISDHLHKVSVSYEMLGC